MINRRRVGRIGFVAAMVAVVALAAMAGPAAAAKPTVDTETTDTSTTSDWTNGFTVQDFEANSSNTSWIEAEFDTTNASIEIVDPATGVVHASNDSTAMNHTGTNSTSGTEFYAWNLSHDELATVPMDANESKNITVRFINDSSLANPDVREITVTLANQDDRAVVYAGPQAAAGTVQGLSANTEVDEPLIGFLGSNSSTTTVEADNVGIVNASGTTIDVIVANTSGEDPFSEASEGGFLKSYSEGDFIATHQLQIQGHNHAVFHNGVPSDKLASGYTHAETTTINGEDAYRVHVADDYSGETSLDITTVANDEYRIDKRLGVQADAFGGYVNALTASTGGTAVGLTAG